MARQAHDGAHDCRITAGASNITGLLPTPDVPNMNLHPAFAAGRAHTMNAPDIPFHPKAGNPEYDKVGGALIPSRVVPAVIEEVLKLVVRACGRVRRWVST